MKIVHALGWYFPESLGGTEIYVRALARRQKQRGHEVRIAAPEAGARDERRYRHDDVEVYRYPIPRSPSRDEAQGRKRVRGAERFHRWLTDVGPDVFHGHSLVTGLGLDEIRIAKSTGARIIVTCHTPALGYLCQRGTMMRYGRELCDGIVETDKCAACALEQSGVPQSLADVAGAIPRAASASAARIPGPMGTALGMRAFIAYNLERQRQLLELADAFVVLTQWAKEVVAKNHANASRQKLVLNRLGIEPNGFRRSQRPLHDPLRIGFIGRFHETKGIFELARAIKSLPESLDFQLELRGPTNSEEERQTAARLRLELGSDARVCFAPAVDHHEVGEVLSSYDLLVCPSTWLEGGPTIAMEAQAVGTPVLGSRIGGLAEIVDDGVNGRLVPPGDVRALADALTAVLEKPECIASWRLKVEAPRTVDDVAGDYEAVYGA